jgi:hypothetical protein
MSHIPGSMIFRRLWGHSESRGLALCLQRRGISLLQPKKDDFVHEPTGRPFGLAPGEKLKLDSDQKIFIVLYLGGLLALTVFHFYKPDDDPRSWARAEAIKRMKKRGVDLGDILPSEK